MEVISRKSKKNIESLSCPICFQMYQNPIILDCGHTFCESCVLHLMEVKEPSCPTCRWRFIKYKTNQPLEKILKLFDINYQDDCLEYTHPSELKSFEVCENMLSILSDVRFSYIKELRGIQQITDNQNLIINQLLEIINKKDKELLELRQIMDIQTHFMEEINAKNKEHEIKFKELLHILNEKNGVFGSSNNEKKKQKNMGILEKIMI